MALLISELYDALKEAGAGEDSARKAAEAVAAYENRLAKLDADLSVIRWMVGGIYALVALIGVPSIWLLLRVAAKVGALGS
jgi:hypothetical protein